MPSATESARDEMLARVAELQRSEVLPAGANVAEHVAFHNALIEWLAANGCESAADWHREMPWADFEAADFVPAVLSRVGADDFRAAGIAADALSVANARFGPMPTATDQVGPHLDRIVRWATGRTRQQLHMWDVTSVGTYRAVGLIPSAPHSVPCSSSRRSMRTRRRRVRSPHRRRARSPGRRSGAGDEPGPPEQHRAPVPLAVEVLSGGPNVHTSVISAGDA